MTKARDTADINSGTNTAVGEDALENNTGSNSTAVGSGAGGNAAMTGSENNLFGYIAGRNITSGQYNTSIGSYSLNSLTTGSSNIAMGRSSLGSSTTCANNVAIGMDALQANTTASNNTALGYQAMFSYQTGGDNVALGTQAGYSINGNGNSTFIGRSAGYSTTGGTNTFVGYNSGTSISSGSKNSILGTYNGNQGGLDIRTSSNNIVLSDGDGNPNLYCAGGNTHINSPTTNPTLVWQSAGVVKWYQYSQDGDSNTLRITSNFSTGVKLTTSATSWSSFSDERLKDIIEPITNATQKVSNLRAVIGKYKTDDEDARRPFLIAQDLQSSLPEAVDDEDIDGMLSIRYTDVIPLLVAAIKEQQETITALTDRITTLEGA